MYQNKYLEYKEKYLLLKYADKCNAGTGVYRRHTTNHQRGGVHISSVLEWSRGIYVIKDDTFILANLNSRLHTTLDTHAAKTIDSSQ